MGFDGTRSSSIAVQLDLVFLGMTFRGRFPVIDQPEGVLGRKHTQSSRFGIPWKPVGMGDHEIISRPFREKMRQHTATFRLTRCLKAIVIRGVAGIVGYP
jgi:hypothetical protein